jgi:hypothetical protein
MGRLFQGMHFPRKLLTKRQVESETNIRALVKGIRGVVNRPDGQDHAARPG